MSKFKKGKNRMNDAQSPETVPTTSVAMEEIPAETATAIVETTETSNVQEVASDAVDALPSVQPMSDSTVADLVAEVIADFESVQLAAPLEEQPVDVEPITTDPIESIDPIEPPVVAAPPVPVTPEMFAALTMIEELRTRLASLTSSGKKRVASGSKPRPNVKYVLLAKAANWRGAPQVSQLLDILFEPSFVAAHKSADGKVEIAEPELFEQIERGHAAGILRTSQPPIRIFQYYRNELRKADCLAWQ